MKITGESEVAAWGQSTYLRNGSLATARCWVVVVEGEPRYELRMEAQDQRAVVDMKTVQELQTLSTTAFRAFVSSMNNRMEMKRGNQECR